MGTHREALVTPEGREVPPTGRRAELPLCVLARLQGGKIVEEHLYFDRLALLAQLGSSP